MLSTLHGFSSKMAFYENNEGTVLKLNCVEGKQRTRMQKEREQGIE